MSGVDTADVVPPAPGLLMAMPFGVAVFDGDHRLLWANPALAASLARAGRRPGAWERPAIEGVAALRSWFAHEAGGRFAAHDVVICPGGQAALVTAVAPRRAVLGIAGPPGAGKTTLVLRLLAALAAHPSLGGRVAHVPRLASPCTLAPPCAELPAWQPWRLCESVYAHNGCHYHRQRQ